MINDTSEAYAYIVQCADNTLYAGWTRNLSQRIEAHNGRTPGGAKYTKSRRPIQLLWWVRCVDKILAQRLEYRLKRLTKQKKVALIEGDERVWQSLIADCVEEDTCAIIRG